MEKEYDYKEIYKKENIVRTDKVWKSRKDMKDERLERKDDKQRPAVQPENFVNLKELTPMAMSYVSLYKKIKEDVFL